MADADHHAVPGQVMGQCKPFVVFRCKGHIADVAACCLLVVLELLHAGLCDVLRRLCALVLHIEVGAFKVDAKDLGTFVAASITSATLATALVSTSTLWVTVVARKLVTPSETICFAQ